MDIVKRWPFDVDNHDVWLDLESHKTCIIARSTNRNKTISCSTKNSWMFCNVWSDKQDAITYLNENGEGPDDYTLEQIACAEFFSVYRAVNYDGKIMLVTGITSGLQVTTTYVPTQRLVTDPTVMWMYATQGDDLVKRNNALVVALSPVTLMSELYDSTDSFENDFVEGQYKLHCCTLMELLKLCEDVYTDGDVYNLKREMSFSKVMHQMMLEKERDINV